MARGGGMTKLIFIRHAASDYLVKDDATRPLTDAGLIAAQNIPALFTHTRIDQFYSSPFIRSINTIQYLANQYDKKIITRSNLQERKVGIWVDNFFEYAQKQWHDFDYKIENGESLNEVQARNIAEVKRILRHHQNQHVVIGTHGTALCTILNYFNTQLNFDYFQSIVNKMPLFIELTFNGLSFISMKELYADAGVDSL